MPDFLFLMHSDTVIAQDPDGWEPYFDRLGAQGVLRGGSAIGQGLSVRRDDRAPAPVSDQLTGFIRIAADDLAQARCLLEGNPVFEAGGTVEIRHLPED